VSVAVSQGLFTVSVDDDAFDQASTEATSSFLDFGRFEAFFINDTSSNNLQADLQQNTINHTTKSTGPTLALAPLYKMMLM
jgi:hypothetical protein